MNLELNNNPLLRAARWLAENERARMTARAKLGHLLAEFGGTYSPADPEKLKVAGVEVSCTGGTANLLSAWKRKAESKLNKAGA
ncbi:hypothetical protein ABWH89_11050 [Hoeflea alexandrii]|uniref:hypothetical protein n=1 Tax=Hoeflea alexandrii TaxID=288436 RepID=UPI0035D0DAC2